MSIRYVALLGAPGDRPLPRSFTLAHALLARSSARSCERWRPPRTRLRAALPAWERRVATQHVGDATAAAVPPQEMARRAWSLAQRTMERVVRAGRYLAKGDAAQEKLWRAYRPAKKAKAPAPAPTPDA